MTWHARVLVVGANGGIGAAVIGRLHEAGHRVVGVDREQVDITLPGGAERALEEAVATLGGLDGLVHAIGMSGRSLGDGPVTRCTDDGWSEVLRVNLESAFRLLRAGIPAVARGGSIVLVGSVLAAHHDRDFLTAAYAVGKAGLVALARVAAMEAAELGIRVNVVAPGLVDTPMAARALGDERILARVRDLQPLARGPVSPAQVADSVAWLLSPATSAVTGHVLPVDGGWSLR